MSAAFEDFKDSLVNMDLCELKSLSETTVSTSISPDVRALNCFSHPLRKQHDLHAMALCQGSQVLPRREHFLGKLSEFKTKLVSLATSVLSKTRGFETIVSIVAAFAGLVQGW